MSSGTSPALTPEVEVEVRLDLESHGPTINANIYGHFAEHLGRCIYEGIWVGEDSTIPNTRGIRNDVVQALRDLKVPVLRWPGGCFADEYHWKDGIGPRAQRPSMLNTHWGGVLENNHFGTHEFMDLCEQIGAEPYVCGNVGSGSVQEMMEWVEYMTLDAESPMANQRRQNGRSSAWKLRYFGVGNESWGCGGNMRPEYYADVYRRYATFVKRYSGNPLQRIACGASGFDFAWTEVLMSVAGAHMDALSLHWYTRLTRGWPRGSATDFGEDRWHLILAQALRMQELVEGHSAIMDKYDPDKRVGLIVDEWGTWYDVEPGENPGFLYQQNSLRDALVAALHLNIFNRHSERVVMANLAQTINVLQAVILTRREKLLLTPTYHVFEMYKVHQGAQRVKVDFDAPEYRFGDASLPMLDASASRNAAGQVHLSLVNLDPQRAARVTLRGAPGRVSGRLLTAAAMTAHNTFEQPTAVQPRDFSSTAERQGSPVLTLPAKSVLMLTLH
ncbi:MAG: alpha-N-arabinofuranosidase [Deltaproteobacteria bacterium]